MPGYQSGEEKLEQFCIYEGFGIYKARQLGGSVKNVKVTKTVIFYSSNKFHFFRHKMAKSLPDDFNFISKQFHQKSSIQ